MKDNTKKGTQFSRRGILPILGGSLLIPFLGIGKTLNEENLALDEKEEAYQTLLKPDGTIVKVKANAIKKSKVVKKNVSNKSFLNWLGKKL
ncbi:MAG: hypothetical protein OEM04_01910 [Flavobacteriaceae bacterium]|nr:hypothetical protein [Flavobacteriaceae bacterium]